MHVVDDVHRVDVNTGEPLHHALELRQHVVEIEVFALDCAVLRTYLFACDFVAAAVDRIEKALGEVRARPEELHLFAHQHR